MRFMDVSRLRTRNCRLIDDKLDCYQRHRGRATAESYYTTYYPSFMEDDNDETQWVSGTWIHTNPGVVWAKMDLGSAHLITKVRLYLMPGNDVQYKIESSLNDSVWTLLFTSANPGGTGEKILYLPGQVGRYWKCTHLDGGSYGWQIGSFDLFGPNQ